MSRIAYVNGHYRPLASARIPIQDRGFLFADAVYEVVALKRGHLIDSQPHLERLQRSLAALSIPSPVSEPVLMQIIRELVRRNRCRDGLVYIQVSRGVAPRDHRFPVPPPKPTLVAYILRKNLDAVAAKARHGVKVITRPEDRWHHCDIKSVALLSNCLARQAAYEAEAFEAWYVDANGWVTEGAATSAWIVTQQGRLVTRPGSPMVLDGITRRTVLAHAKAAQLPIEERAFSLQEALEAAEAFLTSATSFVMPVVRIDDISIGTGQPGPFALRLLEAYDRAALSQPIEG